MVNNPEDFKPACYCHLYDDRCCDRCGLSKAEYVAIYTKIDQTKQPIKQEKIKYTRNGEIKKR